MERQPWNKNKSIGQKIKERRQELGLTQAQLAKLVEVQKQRITDLENSSKRPSAEKLFRISEALQAPMIYFLMDSKLNPVDEEILLVKYRGLTSKNKELIIEFIELLS